MQEVISMEKTWEEMSSSEKQEAMFQKWISPEGLQYVNPEAEKSYKERATRIKDAIQMKKLPDRVPVFTIPSFYPAKYAGFTTREVMYDYDKCINAWRKYYQDFQPDAHGGCVAPGPGPMFDILDYKLYKWPGHGIEPVFSYQCVEGEYMKVDEYDMLIDNPLYFFSNVYPPRIYGALAPFTDLPNLTGLSEMYGSGLNFIPYGVPPVQEAFKTLLAAGSEALKWAGFIGAFEKEMPESGFPAYQGGATKAPFDMIGDTLRGTKGIMTDMYRKPDKLLKALDAITPMLIDMGVGASQMNNNPLVFLPLHKGADGFLSDAQFKKFYWPSLRNVLLGLIDNGVVPFCWAEGGYNSRLEVIKDFPKGQAVWLFDLTDMEKAKKALSNTCCIAGNVPMDLLTVGTPQQVEAYVKKLIDTAGKGGGYILTNGAFFDDVKPENLKVMVDTTKEYGVYK
jgi:hypothetical protein